VVEIKCIKSLMYKNVMKKKRFERLHLYKNESHITFINQVKPTIIRGGQKVNRFRVTFFMLVFKTISNGNLSIVNPKL